MTDLPSGWARTTLGEIGRYLNGRGFRKAEWARTGRPIIRIQNLTGTSSAFNFYAGHADESYIARSGDVLISWAATLGVYVWRGPEAVVNQHIFKVESYVDRGFHRYLVMFALGAMQRETHGSGMVHITRKRFDAIPVFLPPLAEQRRIVAAIDEQLSRLDAADTILCDLVLRLEVMRRAALSASLSPIPQSRPLAELAATQLGKMLSSKAKAGADPRPYLRNKNVRWYGFELEDLLTMDFNEAERAKFSLEPGDVVVCEGGEVGRSAVWRGEVDDCYFQKAVHRVRTTEDLDPDFLVHVLRWFADSNVFERYITGSTINHLPQEDLRTLPIPAPSLKEQQRIVASIAQQLSLIDSLREAVKSAQKRSAVLRRAILERAFRGELVLQDPDDEPASMLLERIGAERAASRPRRKKQFA